MNQPDLNDFIIDILQDFYEISSLVKVLKDSTSNENGEITIHDVSNTLEVIIAKILNTKKSLEKYIDAVFNEE